MFGKSCCADVPRLLKDASKHLDEKILQLLHDLLIFNHFPKFQLYFLIQKKYQGFPQFYLPETKTTSAKVITNDFTFMK